jgi:hypothetical protein
MAITAEQKVANETFFFRMIQMTHNYIWKDTGHLYVIREGKMHATTKKGYRDIMPLVSRAFLKQYIVSP